MNYLSCSDHLNLHLVSGTKELVSKCYRVLRAWVAILQVQAVLDRNRLMQSLRQASLTQQGVKTQLLDSNTAHMASSHSQVFCEDGRKVGRKTPEIRTGSHDSRSSLHLDVGKARFCSPS